LAALCQQGAQGNGKHGRERSNGKFAPEKAALKSGM